MFILMLSASAASLYEVEVTVPVQQVALSSLNQELIAGRLFKKVLHKKTYVTVQSTVPEITCTANGKDVRVDISFDPLNWPTMPEYADCIYQGTTLRIYPVFNEKETAWLVSDKVADFSKGVVVPLNPNETGFATYDLPETIGWTEGLVNAIDEQGNPWTDVFCEVREGSDNQWYMRLQLIGTVERGKGHCPLPSKTNTPNNLMLSIVDAS